MIATMPIITSCFHTDTSKPTAAWIAIADKSSMSAAPKNFWTSLFGVMSFELPPHAVFVRTPPVKITIALGNGALAVLSPKRRRPLRNDTDAPPPTT